MDIHRGRRGASFKAWSLYYFHVYRCSAWPLLACALVFFIWGMGLFLQLLALTEADQMLQAWCRASWRLLLAFSIWKWIAYRVALHEHADRWRWCAVFQTNLLACWAGEWVIGLGFHIALASLCALLGFYFLGDIPLSQLWWQWGVSRILESLLWWSVVQALFDRRPWQSLLYFGCVVLAVYLVGRLGSDILFLIQGIDPATKKLGMIARVFDAFFHLFPPLMAFDEGEGWNGGALGYTALCVVSGIWHRMAKGHIHAV